MPALASETVGDGPTVVALHGFTQTRRSWAPVVDRLAGHFRFVLVDAPGHGGSGDVRTGLAEGARLVGEAGGLGAYMGYSMGARFCLHLALARPDLVQRLVMVGVQPGIVDPEARSARHDDDEQLARRLEQEGVEKFVRWWLAQPLFRALSPDAAGVDLRLGNTAPGLASSLRLAGTGSQEPLWDRLAELDMPVLLVAGAEDAKFARLSGAAADAIGDNARLALVAGAGHACHLERPDAFCQAIAGFLGGH